RPQREGPRVEGGGRQEAVDHAQPGSNRLPARDSEGLTAREAKEEKTMRRALPVWTIALAMAGTPVLAGGGRNVSVTTNRGGPIDRCDQIRVTFDDEEAARSEQELTVPRSRDPLRLHVGENSGLWVQASDRRDF